MENVSTRNSSRLEISRNLRYRKNCISVNSELKLFRRRQCLRKLYLFSVPTKGKFSKIEWLINRFRPFYKKEDWNFCSILLYVHLFSNKLCYETYKQCLYYEYTVHHASFRGSRKLTRQIRIYQKFGKYSWLSRTNRFNDNKSTSNRPIIAQSLPFLAINFVRFAAKREYTHKPSVVVNDYDSKSIKSSVGESILTLRHPRVFFLTSDVQKRIISTTSVVFFPQKFSSHTHVHVG